MSDILERQAEERLVKIICDQQTLDHPYARVSATHLKRLLLNIAGNAVKYNRQGGHVHLTCREVEPVDGVPVYEYTISDNGIGMSEEFQQHLYEPFSREEQQVEGASSGTGLGASIAKQLVELMGGTMSFTSTLGQGTTFTIACRLRSARAPRFLRQFAWMRTTGMCSRVCVFCS